MSTRWSKDDFVVVRKVNGMSTISIHDLTELFAQRAEATLRVGLQIEADCQKQLDFEGVISPGKYQAAMINFCCAIENSAKCIVARECPPGVFSLTSRKGKLTGASLRDLWKRTLHPSDFHRLLLNHHLLSFEETLNAATEANPDLRYPVDSEILFAARNQAVHSLVLDEARQVDLVAVTALYMVDFLRSRQIARLSYALTTQDQERLQTFQTERGLAAKSAHDALRKIRSKRLRCENPEKYCRDRDTDDHVHVRCPLCGVRARIVIDRSRTWLESGSVALLQVDTSNLQIIYPKHFTCPGCELELFDRAVSEAGLRFEPMPLPSILDAWRTDDTPLTAEELAQLCEE